MMPMTLSAFVGSPATTFASAVPGTDMYEVDSRIFTPEDMDEYTRWLAETPVSAWHA